MRRPSLPVVWLDPSTCAPAVGRLTLHDGHADLDGAQGAKPRSYEFKAEDIESCDLVCDFRTRLNGRPTLSISLKGRGRLLIAEAMGFGHITEIAYYLRQWRTPTNRPITD